MFFTKKNQGQPGVPLFDPACTNFRNWASHPMAVPPETVDPGLAGRIPVPPVPQERAGLPTLDREPKDTCAPFEPEPP